MGVPKEKRMEEEESLRKEIMAEKDTKLGGGMDL